MNEERYPVGRAADALPDNMPVWRYMSLCGVVDTIARQQLRLTRVDKFRDAFEGSVTKQQMEQQEQILLVVARQQLPSDEDRRALITRLRRARTRSAHVSSWAYGDESEALWRLYCTDDKCQGRGVALRTTLAKLTESVRLYDLDVRPITYVDYEKAPPFTGEMAPLFHKRFGFRADQELRLLKFNEEHFRALCPKNASVPELDEHVFLPWVLGDVIDEIIITPYADEEYEQRVRDSVKTVDGSLADRVVLSALHERENRPRF